MNKKKSRRFVIDPQFKKDTEERYGHTFDLSDMPDEMKISARLIAIAEPFHGGELDYFTLYDCATIAWNECLREDHNKKIDYLLHNMLLNFANYRDMIDMLKERKRRLFFDDIRGIREVAVFRKGDDKLTINVVSDIEAELMAKAMLERLKRIK